MSPPSIQFLRPNSAIVLNSSTSLTLHIQSISKSFRSYFQNIHWAWWFINTITWQPLFKQHFFIYFLNIDSLVPDLLASNLHLLHLAFQNATKMILLDTSHIMLNPCSKFFLCSLRSGSRQPYILVFTPLHGSLPLCIRVRCVWPIEDGWWYATSKIRL